MSTLTEIQNKLKVPKNQYNKFGQYNYRSCEDIFEAVKPLLGECKLYLTDNIVEIGGKNYVKAKANFVDESGILTTTEGFAREPGTRKGMSDEQITGSASSYARKYALNGLFLIDDTKEVDSVEPVGGLPEDIKIEISLLSTVQDLNSYYQDKKKTMPQNLTKEFIKLCADRKSNIAREVVNGDS